MDASAHPELFLRIERGNPTADEVAAVAVTLLARAERSRAEDPGAAPRPAFWNSVFHIRSRTAPGSWRSAGDPGPANRRRAA